MKQAKIAQREKHIERLYCRCGGTVEKVSIFRNGKLHNVARCKSCGVERRKPGDFRRSQ